MSLTLSQEIVERYLEELRKTEGFCLLHEIVSYDIQTDTAVIRVNRLSDLRPIKIKRSGS